MGMAKRRISEKEVFNLSSFMAARISCGGQISGENFEYQFSAISGQQFDLSPFAVRNILHSMVIKLYAEGCIGNVQQS